MSPFLYQQNSKRQTGFKSECVDFYEPNPEVKTIIQYVFCQLEFRDTDAPNANESREHSLVMRPSPQKGWHALFSFQVVFTSKTGAQ